MLRGIVFAFLLTVGPFRIGILRSDTWPLGKS
jgi:hypothetical protein